MKSINYREDRHEEDAEDARKRRKQRGANRSDNVGDMMVRERWQARAGANGRVILYDKTGQGLTPWVEIKRSKVPQGGKGLWAMRPFEEGEAIGVYMGKVIHSYNEKVAYLTAVQSEAKREGGDAHADEYIMQAGSTWVDGNVRGLVMQYANDARGTRWSNNARPRAGGKYGIHNEGDDEWGITIEATRPMQAGEEIFNDYGSEYWRDRAPDKVAAGGSVAATTTSGEQPAAGESVAAERRASAMRECGGQRDDTQGEAVQQQCETRRSGEPQRGIVRRDATGRGAKRRDTTRQSTTAQGEDKDATANGQWQRAQTAERVKSNGGERDGEDGGEQRDRVEKGTSEHYARTEGAGVGRRGAGGVARLGKGKRHRLTHAEGERWHAGEMERYEVTDTQVGRHAVAGRGAYDTSNAQGDTNTQLTKRIGQQQQAHDSSRQAQRGCDSGMPARRHDGTDSSDGNDAAEKRSATEGSNHHGGGIRKRSDVFAIADKSNACSKRRANEEPNGRTFGSKRPNLEMQTAQSSARGGKSKKHSHGDGRNGVEGRDEGVT